MTREQPFTAQLLDRITVDMPTLTIGPTNPGTSHGIYTGIASSQATLTQRGTLQSLGMWWTGAQTGINFALGLYSDSGDLPVNLVASSAVGSSIAGLNTLAIAGGPILSPRQYLVAVCV